MNKKSGVAFSTKNEAIFRLAKSSNDEIIVSVSFIKNKGSNLSNLDILF